ncbi:MAG: hypothetical protein M3509_10410, partial [Chloroflexota bacterium]|nr:hypothetical protein [Chloroflexota bacterium]
MTPPAPSIRSASASTGAGGVFDLATVEGEIAELEQQSIEPGFWDDSRVAQDVMRSLGDLRGRA